MAMKRERKYRVRRLSPTKFRIVNPQGLWVENEQGNPSNYATHEAAVKALRNYERGIEKEPHPLIDFEDCSARHETEELL